MNLQLIRNATLRLIYANRQIVIDPYLAPKHSLPSFTGRSPNPMVDLPCTPEEALADAELLLVSHLHTDHFDPLAQQLLPRDVPLLCQPGDKERIEELGVWRVTVVEQTAVFDVITIHRTLAQHGSGEVLKLMGNASGFVLQADGEPTVYWVGDSIWFDGVAQTIAHFQPEVIITHSCGAVWGDNVLIVMDAEQTVQVCQAAPHATVVATHMEALDHSTISRAALRQASNAAGISASQLRIPADGETLTF